MKSPCKANMGKLSNQLRLWLATSMGLIHVCGKIANHVKQKERLFINRNATEGIVTKFSLHFQRIIKRKELHYVYWT